MSGGRPYCGTMSEGTRPIRVGLVGYGMAGEKLHAPLIDVTDGMELAAVVTANPERQRRARGAHPDVVVVDQASELMTAGPELGLELVVVAAPNRAHVPVALAALEAGFAVVVDKPLANTAADARRVVAAAHQRGLLLSAFHNRRWDGDFLTVARLVNGGALGQVLRFESRFERWRPDIRTGAWRERSDPAEGGGLLLDLQTHLVDQAIVLLGPPTSVYAEIKRRRPGVTADDDTFIALEHAGGAVSHLWASAVAAQTGPRFRVLGAQAGYVVHGMDVQEAALLAGDRPGRPGWGQAPAERWGTLGAGDDLQPVPTEPGDYPRFYAGLVASLREGAPPPVLAAEAVLGLEVLDAARRSAVNGEVIAITPE
jgi:scyllo-inositol 2-dehydrogenase (NADP+)